MRSGNGLISTVMSVAGHLPDKQTAQEVYEVAGKQIKRCLSKAPNQWQIKLSTLPDNKGEMTEYLLNGSTRGSLKKVRTGGLFSDDWTIYLLVDSPKMVKPYIVGRGPLFPRSQRPRWECRPFYPVNLYLA